MRIEGEYTFDGPRETVWELLREPEVLAAALPGTQSLDKISESEYEGKMHVRVGPVAGAFSGRIAVSDEVPPESYTLSVEGRGSPGFVKGVGHVQLLDQGDATTLMKYEGDLQAGGRLASVGQRLMDTVSKSIIKQGLESINEALKARMAANPEAADAEESSHRPRSETQFAAAVAKDVAGEIMTPTRLFAIAIAIVVVAAVVALILASTGGG